MKIRSCFSKIIIFIAVVFLSSGVYAEDRLQLEGVSIIGNDEMPGVLYVSPWQKLRQRISTGKPVNSLINEKLVSIEREMFLRRLKYYSLKD